MREDGLPFRRTEMFGQGKCYSCVFIAFKATALEFSCSLGEANWVEYSPITSVKGREYTSRTRSRAPCSEMQALHHLSAYTTVRLQHDVLHVFAGTLNPMIVDQNWC